jgi:hypothetical protein
METVSTCISPPYSLVLLLDPEKGVVPQTMAGRLVAATESCVAVGCRAEDDGSTRITMGKAVHVDPGYQPLFEGDIETPSQYLEVQSVEGTTLLRTSVQGHRTRVSIWVNDTKEPDEITVGIDAD